MRFQIAVTSEHVADFGSVPEKAETSTTASRRVLSTVPFVPERDYVTFRHMLSQIRLSSITFVHPTKGVEAFGNISSLLCTLAILRPPCEIITEIVPLHGNPSVGVLNARGVAK